MKNVKRFFQYIFYNFLNMPPLIGLVFVLALSLTIGPFQNKNDVLTISQPSNMCAIQLSGGSDSKRDKPLDYRFDEDLHSKWYYTFPDMLSRTKYESKQIKIVQGWNKKCEEARKFSTRKPLKPTQEEQNAIDYFNGTGMFSNYQKLSTPPNKYDTRNSFVKKMHSRSVREKFFQRYFEDLENVKDQTNIFFD